MRLSVTGGKSTQHHVSPGTRPGGIAAADDEVRMSAGVAAGAPPAQAHQRHVALARLDHGSEVGEALPLAGLHQPAPPGRSVRGSARSADRRTFCRLNPPGVLAGNREAECLRRPFARHVGDRERHSMIARWQIDIARQKRVRRLLGVRQ